MLTLAHAARAPQPRMFAPVDDRLLPADVLKPFRENKLTLGLPEAADVPAVASTLVRCFYESAVTPPPDGVDDAYVNAAQEFPLSTPPPELFHSPRLHERWRMACKGLHWRLGARLRPPPPSADADPFAALVASSRPGEESNNDDDLLASSLETSLLLALREGTNADGPFVACAEISLRPIDGRLPGEFAVPALFQLHAAELGAYLSNVAVLPEYRRRGLASKLLFAVEHVVREEWGMSALHLHLDLRNENARRLYAAYEPLPEYDAMCTPPKPPVPLPAVKPSDDIAWSWNKDAKNRFHKRELFVGSVKPTPQWQQRAVTSREELAK